MSDGSVGSLSKYLSYVIPVTATCIHRGPLCIEFCADDLTFVFTRHYLFRPHIPGIVSYLCRQPLRYHILSTSPIRRISSFKSTTMDNYIATLNNVGESVVAWADPNKQYTGYTNVCLSLIAMIMPVFRLKPQLLPLTFRYNPHPHTSLPLSK